MELALRPWPFVTTWAGEDPPLVYLWGTRPLWTHKTARGHHHLAAVCGLCPMSGWYNPAPLGRWPLHKETITLRQPAWPRGEWAGPRIASTCSLEPGCFRVVEGEPGGGGRRAVALGHVSAFTEHLGLLLRCVSLLHWALPYATTQRLFSEISPRHEDFNQGWGWGEMLVEMQCPPHSLISLPYTMRIGTTCQSRGC